MASAENSSEYVDKLSKWYGEDVVAVEEDIPGIFQPLEDPHEVLGDIDLLIEEDPGSLKAYEVKETGSLNQRTVLGHARDARKQCDKIESYLEDVTNYSVDAEPIVTPKGHLKAIYEIWEGLPEEFELDQAKDTVSEPGRIPYLEREVMDRKEKELYELDSSLTALFESKTVQL
ncbi:hypothetical protein [Candidatus Nanohalococcus occultus]|uniref:Uncharacterized protein n=1 Tax=Candidatus Nanohalococcus occultus TaxID=2978047 RepID=A0ABY8CG91_9ARCH|nr:hypothetical protein SVXNc_0733 [Candidatus Nanohaloarchaeota archaeon SVXNc]